MEKKTLYRYLENLPAGIYLAKVSMGENTTIIRFKK